MGIFNSYLKPGKGITREDALKRNYFEILWRKLSKVFTVNLLYFACNIVFFGAALFLASGLLPSDENMAELENYIISLSQGKTFLPILPFLPFMFIGPATAGLTYVSGCFARQEYTFLVSDFFEHAKKNFRQGILASIIITVVLYTFLNAFVFYYFNYPANRSMILVLFMLLGYIFITATFYVYPLIVTFEMKLSAVFKNSILFALSNLPWNLLTFAALLAVHGLLIHFLPVIWVILMPVFLIAWSAYTINFTVWGAIEKQMKNK